MQAQLSREYVPTYMRPDFAQSLDRSRPRELLTANPLRSGSLEYRYTDTGETTTVPNIWYNQTIAANVARIRYDASRYDEHVRQLTENPPIGYSKEAIRREISQYRRRASIAREAADRLERGQESFLSQVSDFFRTHSVS
jgi:hypothetical protein